MMDRTRTGETGDEWVNAVEEAFEGGDMEQHLPHLKERAVDVRRQIELLSKILSQEWKPDARKGRVPEAHTVDQIDLRIKQMQRYRELLSEQLNLASSISSAEKAAVVRKQLEGVEYRPKSFAQ